MWWCSCTLCFVIHLCFLAKNQWGWKPLGPLRPLRLRPRTFTYSFQMSRAAPKLGVVKQGSCGGHWRSSKVGEFFVCMSDRCHKNYGVTPRFFFGTDADVANRKSGADAYTAPCTDFTVSLRDVPRN